MPQRTILVVGGALAGPTAAARARELDEDARIVLIERSRRVSYAQCGLAYHLSGEVTSIADLDRERAEFFDSVYRIEVWTETEAVRLDSQRKTLTVRRGGREEAVGYDALVVALGAASRTPENLKAQADNVVSFRTIDDLEAIRRIISNGGRRVAVLGGGAMGIEAADGLIRQGAEVTLVEREANLLPRLGRRLGAAARAALAQKARVFTRTTVESSEMRRNAVAALGLSNGENVAVDLVICTLGLIPRSEIVKAAGGELAAEGTIRVDDSARTSLPNVYACGVCVSAPQIITGKPVWWPQGALADKTAQVAGASAAGGSARLSAALGSMLVRAWDTTVGRTGLSLAEAQAHLGTADVGVSAVYAPSHERYFPQSALLLLQLVWNRRDGRVLGVEAAGAGGVDKRTDAAAAAIAAGLTVEKLAVLDFGYEPPYNAARDPLNVAATIASLERAGLGRSIEPEELHHRLAEVQLVDVRAPGSTGFPPIHGSLAIPLEELRQRLDRLDRARPVVTVSQNGRRGWLATRLLAQKGFANVANLSGGLRAWSLAELAERTAP